MAMAGFGTVLARAVPRRLPGPDPEHPPGAPARLPGWHAVEDALAAGATVDRLHRPPGHARASTPGPMLAQEEVPVLAGDTVETLHERIKEVERRLYPATIRRRDRRRRGVSQAAERRGTHDEGAALGLRQDRPGDSPGAGRPRLGARRQRRDRGRAGRGRRSPTRGRRRSPAPPRCSGAGSRRCTRRSTAASWPTAPSPSTWPTSPPRTSSPSTWWSATSTRSRSDPSIELIDVGGPDHGAGRGQEPRPRRRGRRPRRLRRRPRGAARRRVAVADDPPPPGRAPPSPTPPPTTPPSSPGSTPAAPGERAPTCCRPPCTSRSSGPRSCATARTRTSAAPATATPGTADWWDGVVQHGGIALSLPQPLRRRRRLAAGPRARHGADATAVAIIKHANPCGAAVAADLADGLPRALECDPRLAPSAASWPWAGRATRRWPGLVAETPGRRPLAPAFDPEAIDAPRRPAQEHAAARGTAAQRRALELRSLGGGYLVQDADRS